MKKIFSIVTLVIAIVAPVSAEVETTRSGNNRRSRCGQPLYLAWL